MPNCSPQNGVATIANLGCVFQNVVKSLLGFAGIVLFVMLLLGGFKYITSGGDPKAVDSAQKTLTYAIGGLVVVVLAYIILLLIQQITGANVTLFKITLP